MNPLVAGDQFHAFRLAHNAYLKMKDSQADRALRINLALAAFLQNRAEDDGRLGFRVGTFMGNYAVSTALHIRFPSIGQGEATSVVQAHTIRLAEDIQLDSVWQVCHAFGISKEGRGGGEAALAVADWLEEIYDYCVDEDGTTYTYPEECPPENIMILADTYFVIQNILSLNLRSYLTKVNRLVIELEF
mgnify:CR=1 FL=1